MFEAPSLKLDIAIAGQRLSEDVVNMCRINVDDMLTEIVEHSASYAYIAMLEVEADAELSALKDERDTLYGELLLGLADEKEARGRNFTVAMQEATVKRTPSMIEANESVKEAEKKVKQLKVLVKSFEARKDMLASAALWISRSETPPYAKPNPKDAVASARAKKVSG